MVIAKKIKFGKTASKNSYTIVNPVEGSLYIPVSDYTKAEIAAMWSTVRAVDFPTAFAQYGLIGAGGSCYNPGYYTGDIYNLTSYQRFCNESVNPDCIMPHVDSVTGQITNTELLAYANDAGDGFFWEDGSTPYLKLRLNNQIVFYVLIGYRASFGLYRQSSNDTYGYVGFLFITSDNEIGLFKITAKSRDSSTLKWLTSAQKNYVLTFLDTLPDIDWATGQYSDPVTITEWDDYTRLVRKPGYTKLCRLRFLNPDGSTAFSLDNDPYNRRSGAFIAAGNLNVNLQNGTRRTADVTLNNADAEFDYNYNKVWFGTEIALDMGLALTDGTEFYLPQGVFRVVTPTEDVNPSGNSVHFQLSDKWSGLDGTLNGNLEASYIVNEGTNIFAPISTLLASDRGDGQPFDRESPIFTEYYNGKTQALPDGTSAPLTNAPYDLVVDSDDGTLAELILQLCGMVNAWVGYDRSGRLRIDPSQDDIDDADKPVLWRFSMDETQLISMAYESKISDVKNDYIVVGMQASDYSQPAARVQNLDPQSDVNINLIGRRTKRESKPEFATQQICEDYAVWMAKRTAVLHKAVTISCSQLFHLEENGLIEIIRTDKNPAVAELHLIQGFSIPLATDQPMSITATSVNDFPDVTITAWPPEE